MPLPLSPRRVLRAALITVLIGMALANGVVLIAVPERVAGGWPLGPFLTFVLRAAGVGSIALAFLTLWRVTRVVPLLMMAGAAGFPVMIAAVQAQPVVVAGVVMSAIVVGCVVLDRAWLEAVWAGRRF